jgi:hypothetical protein
VANQEPEQDFVASQECGGIGVGTSEVGEVVKIIGFLGWLAEDSYTATRMIDTARGITTHSVKGQLS